MGEVGVHRRPEGSITPVRFSVPQEISSTGKQEEQNNARSIRILLQRDRRLSSGRTGCMKLMRHGNTVRLHSTNTVRLHSTIPLSVLSNRDKLQCTKTTRVHVAETSTNINKGK